MFETAKVEDPELSKELSAEWVGRAWRAFLNVGEDSKTRGLASRRTAEEVEKTLTRLEGRADKSAFATTWDIVEKEAGLLFSQEGTSSKSLDALVMALKAVLRSTSDEVKVNGKNLAKGQIKGAITAVQQGREDGREEMLKFLASTKDLVKDDAEIQQELDDLCLQHLPAYIPTSAGSLSLLVSHLATTSPASRSSIWQSLFATSPSPIVFLRLIDSVSQGGLAQTLPSAELDTQVLKIAHKILVVDRAGSDDELEILRRLMLRPQPFVETALPSQIVSLLVDSLIATVSLALKRSSVPSTSSLAPLVPITALLANYVQKSENAKQLATSELATVALFHAGFVLPSCRIDDKVPGEAIAAARQAWQEIVRIGGDAVVGTVMTSLKTLLVDADARPSAVEVVQAGSVLLSTFPSSQLSLSSLLPSPDDFDELRQKLSLSDPSPALSILEPLAPVSDSPPLPAPSFVDSASLSAYPRTILGYLEIASRDHSLARKSLWIVPHLLLLANCAKDQLSLSSTPTGMFGASISEEVLERLIGAGEGASSYLLSSAANSLPDNWHAQAVTHLRGREPAATEDQLVKVLDGLARQARGGDAQAGYAQRAVATVLSSALRYSESGSQDAERWLALSQNLPSGKYRSRPKGFFFFFANRPVDF